jgi:hypothetical protein
MGAVQSVHLVRRRTRRVGARRRLLGARECVLDGRSVRLRCPVSAPWARASTGRPSLESWRVALSDERTGKRALESAARKALESLKPPEPDALLAHTDVVEALCAAVLPRHGLDDIAKAMKPVGTDLTSLFNANHRRVWPQVETAFAVRHLIEHRDGRIDRAFRRTLSAPLWMNSSWGERLGELTERHEKITVTEADLRATAEAMLGALAALDGRCAELAARRSTPP